MPNPLDKVIDLIKRTGDNSIILDQSGEPQYVVMSFAKYQAMVGSDKNLAGLTENQLLEKINDDVAAWKEENPANTGDIAPVDHEEVKTFPQEETVDWTNPGENSLNKAKKEQESEDSHSGEKYYFEPID